VEDRVKLGELHETTLTLRELDAIVDSFVATLRGVFHPRIEYPELQPKAGSENALPSPPLSEVALDEKTDIPTVPAAVHSDP
jgi:hypothetical protein